MYVLRKPLVLSTTVIIIPSPKTAGLFPTVGVSEQSAGSKRNIPAPRSAVCSFRTWHDEHGVQGYMRSIYPFGRNFFSTPFAVIEA